eukprot:scaffold8626_cov202-Skeletonema_dohrnii-CCMP3373.AAC.3
MIKVNDDDGVHYIDDDGVRASEPPGEGDGDIVVIGDNNDDIDSGGGQYDSCSLWIHSPVLYGRCFYRLPSPLEVDCSPLEIDVSRVGFIVLPLLFSMDIVPIGWGMVEVILRKK